MRQIELLRQSELLHMNTRYLRVGAFAQLPPSRSPLFNLQGPRFLRHERVALTGPKRRSHDSREYNDGGPRTSDDRADDARRYVHAGGCSLGAGPCDRSGLCGQHALPPALAFCVCKRLCSPL